MRYSIVKAILILPLLIAGTHSTIGASVDPAEVFSYWGEEGTGGGSYLGVDTCDITKARMASLQLKEERGVEVTMVDQDAPAGKAGIHEHDVIMSINGEQVESVEQLRRMIHEIPPGRAVNIGVSRNGQPLTVQAQLARRKDFSSVGPEFKFVMPNLTTLPELDIPASIVVVHASARSGLMVENLSPQLGDFFGTKDGHGILVRSVERGSCAEKAGFHAGDVIIRVNGEAVNDAGDFGQALRDRKSNAVSISIVRGRKEQTLTLTLPEPRHTGYENVGVQEIGARTRKDISEAESQLAQVKPQLDLAIHQIQVMKPEIEKATQQELSRLRQQVQEEMRRMCCQQEEQKEQTEHQKGSTHEEQRDQQEQLHELTGPQADI